MDISSTDHETTRQDAPDAPLVARARAGERAAFDALVTRHFDTIQKAIYRRCHDWHEAHARLRAAQERLMAEREIFTTGEKR